MISSDPVGQLPLRYHLIPPRYYMKFRAWRTRAKSARKRGERELWMLKFLVPRGRTSVDVGANRGVYAYFLSKLSSKVICYEPNPWCARFLERALPGNCELRMVALSNKAGTAEFIVPYAEHKANALRHNIGRIGSDARGMTFDVKTSRLDDENLADVGFMKIDTEGHEMAVIDGALGTIQRDRPVMLVEILDARGHQAGNPKIEYIRNLGYECFCLSGLDHLTHYTQNRTGKAERNFIFLPLGA